ETASKQGIKVLLNGARGNHSISWGSMTLTFNFYADLFKRLRWIQLFNELDSYCRRFYTGKSVMIPFIAKRAFTMIYKEQSNDSFPLLVHPSLAEKTNVYEKFRTYGLDTNGLPDAKNLTQYRRNYYQQLHV